MGFKVPVSTDDIQMDMPNSLIALTKKSSLIAHPYFHAVHFQHSTGLFPTELWTNATTVLLLKNESSQDCPTVIRPETALRLVPGHVPRVVTVYNGEIKRQ